MRFEEVINTAIIEFIKSHNEYAGKVAEVADHIKKAIEILNSLPPNIQEELKQSIYSELIIKGFINRT